MEGIRQYILSIVLAAVVVGILSCFFRKGSVFAAPFTLIAGVYLVLVVTQPLFGFRMTYFDQEPMDVYKEAEGLIENSIQMSRTQMKGIIKDQVITYIQNKASSMGLVLQIEVTLTEDDLPVPWSIHLWGAVSPRERELMEQYILDNFAITGERVFWN